MTLSEENQSPTGNVQPVRIHLNVSTNNDHDCRPWEQIYVVGNLPELGAWDPYKALLLQPNGKSKTMEN